MTLPLSAIPGIGCWFNYEEKSSSCGECRTGPAINLYVGTQAVFHDSMVAPQTEHSKLAICRVGAIASVRL